jgi:type VI secretion system FHA domain protein
MIVLRLVRRPDGVPAGTAPLRLPEAGASIGRAPDCDLVLDDPLRLVSRRHAWLVPHDAGSATLRCVSTSANLLVNGEALEPGAECLVQIGDRLRIGGFEVELGMEADAAPVSIELPQQPPPAPPPVAAPVSVLLDADPLPPAAPAPELRRRLDRFFQLDTVADPLGPGSPLPRTQETLLARTPPPPGAAVPAPPAAALPAAVPAVAPRPAPAVVPAVAAEPAPPEPGTAAAGSADAQALRAAFVRGARLDPSVELTLDAAWMEHLGRLLRASTEGTVELLRSRAVAKRNIRAEGTQIAQRENNLLKFTPDAAEALRLLVSLESRPGFLGAVEALRDAHEDLQLHQLAMIAGMRAAVADLIARLGPEALIADEGPARGLARFSSLLRDASLWQRHVQGHARLIDNLDDTFEAIFGREFLRAYEAQARRRPQGD